MPNVYRTLTRLRDMDDVDAPSGAGDNSKAYVWDNAQSKFVLVAHLPLTGGTVDGAVTITGKTIVNTGVGIGSDPGSLRLLIAGGTGVEGLKIQSAAGRAFEIKIEDAAPTQIQFGSTSNNSFSIIRNNINRMDFFNTVITFLDNTGANIAVLDTANLRLDILGSAGGGPGSSSSRLSGGSGNSWLNANGGNLGVGTNAPAISDGNGIDLNGKILRLRTSKTPASAGATGNAGEFCWDSSYFYICIASNTWRRVAHASW